MSIPNFGNKIKSVFGKNNILVFNLIVLVLVAIGSFVLGRLSSLPEIKEGSEEITILNQEGVPPIALIDKSEIRYIASKNGKMYYNIDCAGAKRIKPENQIWFKTEEDALKSGFNYSKSCKK